MSDKIEVSADEHGVVRVFAVDLDADELRAFGQRNGAWPAAEALGVDTLAPDQVELFPASDLAGVGLSGYLEEGLGVAAEELEDMRARLDSLERGVLILRSRAFGGQAVTLKPRAPLRHVATFHEARPKVQFEPLPSSGAVGTVAGTGTAGAPASGRGWWAVILLIAGVAVGLLALALS
ncbi:hypothetical protein D6850_01520 [Roseovarius spongiae]|uniref:Aspartate carbamoyltransferase catalytic subunit n=1 Tax=Roseovarius spongiae TaxID=2320272 RepID=A0A3A8AZA0_9RHOB|nr:hypothetical protein [Roseovarius spongiae]RKF16270.1 hypothetical protein D6850_01520 [Roseovarius spongiae]